VYPFPNLDISRMLDNLLKANLIELSEGKHPDEANQVDNPSYYKYHHLISHPIEKCVMLKDKIMRLHENGDVIFYYEIAASNITIMINLEPYQSFPRISFGSFEPIKLGVILFTSFTISSNQTSCITFAPKVGNLKPNSS